MDQTPQTPTVKANITKWEDHPNNSDWIIVGPFSANFIQEKDGNSNKIFADEYNSTVNGEVRGSGKWHFCDEQGVTTQIYGTEEEFYIKAKKTWIGSGNLTFQLKTRRLRVRAEWWDIVSQSGNQAQILMASAIRDFVYANATAVVVSPPYITISKEDQDTHEKLAGVQFHIYKGANQYITGFDSSDYPTYGTKENAKTFTTNSSGNTEKFKVEMINSYKAEEISVGDNLGYTAGKVFNIDVRKGDNTITLKNKREFIPVSGYVWEDLASENAPKPNGFYKKGDNDVNDKLVKGVKVELVKENPKTGQVEEVQEQDTDKDGKYRFSTVKIDEIANYYIRFYYNGMCYENVSITKGDPKGSKAGEGTDRQDFNKSYSTIEGSTEDTGVAFDDEGNKTHELTYKTTKGKSEISYRKDKKESEYNYGYEENKNSKCPVNGVDDQYMIMATTRNACKDEKNPEIKGNLDQIYTTEQIRKDGIKEVDNINLGIQKRAQPDIALGKDLHNVKLAINGYGHTYFYHKRFEADHIEKEEDGFNVGVKYKSKWTQSYTREIYRSDYNFKYIKNETEKEKRELKVWITYELKMIQANKDLKTTVNSIIDCYDENYKLVKVGTSISNETGKIEGDIETESKGKLGKYERVLIKNETELQPNVETSIYVQFEMNREAVEKILTEKDENLDNIAEINSYSISNGGIDIDSNPGNATSGEEINDQQTEYEDDTSVSPGIKLMSTKTRKLSGKVFVDQATGGIAIKTKQERKGDGEYKQGEPGVPGVKVTFEEARSGETYEAETDKNGDFLIEDYIPGDYTLTYTWGGQKYELNGEQKTITVQDYKGTIYNDPSRKQNKEWYKKDLETDSIRYSDATDNWKEEKEVPYGSRKQIDGELERINQKTQITRTQMNSTTPEMKIRIECQETESKIVDEIEYQEKEPEAYQDYIIRNVDFGITERPKQELKIVKRVKSLQLTLANGQTIADVTIDNNGKVDGIRTGVSYMPPNYEMKDNGFLRLELDNELIQGSKLQVTYEIKVTNISEIDYEDEEYYYYGTGGVNPVTITPTKIIDYLDNGWAFDEEGSDWKITKSEEIKDYLDEAVLKELKKELKSNKKSKKLLWTDKLKGKTLEIGQASEPLELKVSKILTTADEIWLDNETEIIELTKNYGRLPEAIPGNYIPATEKFVETDDSMAETVSITPATGRNNNIILSIIIGVTSCATLGVGIVFIKKKVIG